MQGKSCFNWFKNMIISGVALLTFWPQPKDLKVSFGLFVPPDMLVAFWQGVKNVLVKLGSEACSSSSARWASTDSECNSTSTGGWCYSTGDGFMAAYAVALIEHQSPNEALWFAVAAASSCVRAKDAILSMSERQAVLRCLVDYTCIKKEVPLLHEQVKSSWDCISNHCCCYYHHMYTDRGWGCMWIYYPVLFTMKSLKHSC